MDYYISSQNNYRTDWWHINYVIIHSNLRNRSLDAAFTCICEDIKSQRFSGAFQAYNWSIISNSLSALFHSLHFRAQISQSWMSLKDEQNMSHNSAVVDWSVWHSQPAMKAIKLRWSDSQVSLTYFLWTVLFCKLFN